MVAVWPSFLMHTTQPLKDPLFILLALLFLTINCCWLISDYSWARALAIATLGVVTEFLLWIVRSDMWELMIAIGLLTCGTLIMTMLRERKIARGNIAGAVLLLGISVMIPRMAVQFYLPAIAWAEGRGVATLYKNTNPSASESDLRVAAAAAQETNSTPSARISSLRERFAISYPSAGSNVNTDVKFYRTAAVCAEPTPSGLG